MIDGISSYDMGNIDKSMEFFMKIDHDRTLNIKSYIQSLFGQKSISKLVNSIKYNQNQMCFQSEWIERLNPNDFIFKVGNEQYPCNRIFADLLSPYVANIHNVDPSIDSFQLNIKDKNKDFQFFMNLVTKGFGEYDPTNIAFYYQVSKLLGNFDLIESFHQKMNPIQKLTPEVAVEEILYQYTLEKDIDFLIGYCAKNFNECSNYIGKLPIELITLIVESPSLVLYQEADLLEFINQFSLKCLLPYIDISRLSSDELERYLKLLSLDSIYHEVWDQICNRLVNNSTPVTTYSTRYKKQFSIKKENLFDGILSYLSQKAGGNCASKGLIHLFASTTNSGKPTNLVEYNDFTANCSWRMGNEENGFLQFDFKGKKVVLDSYSLHTPTNCGSKNHFPKSWTIEGSNNEKDWTIIDVRNDDCSLNGEDKSNNFECQTNEPYRYIRLYQRGTSHFKPNLYFYLYISGIEFFGDLIDSDGTKVNPKQI